MAPAKAFLAAFLAAGVLAHAPRSSSNNRAPPMQQEFETHFVTAGLTPDHQFDPPTVEANVDDLVVFTIYGNHSVIESLYRWPCVPRAAVDVDGPDGFNLDYPPAEYVEKSRPFNRTYKVVSNDPVWFYCGAQGSCITGGMLGAINPSDDQNLRAQQDLANKAGVVRQFGETISDEERASIEEEADEIMGVHKHTHTLSKGAIAGIAVGSAAVIVLVGILIYHLRRNRKQVKELLATRHRSQEPPTPAHYSEMYYNGHNYVAAPDPNQPPSYYPDPKAAELSLMSSPTAPNTVYSPSLGSMRNRYSEISEGTFRPTSPQPATVHELYVQPEDEGEKVQKK